MQIKMLYFIYRFGEQAAAVRERRRPMNRFLPPDFQNSVLNISATLAEFLGAPNQNAALPVLREELGRDYRNVVFLCFDGLGLHPLRQNLAGDDFLFRNLRQTLRSTFPSTTTNATRSLLTNRLPLEHGWFGWSMYVPALRQNVDIYPGLDSLTHEAVDRAAFPLDTADFYFDQTRGDYAVHTVFPPYVPVKHEERNLRIQSGEEFWSAVEACCRRPGRQFVYAYYPDPDSTMHRYGVSSPEARHVIRAISAGLKTLHRELTDTLLIVSADHGQVDIEGYVDLYGDERLMSFLQIYPFLEARAPAFLVREGCGPAFESYFRERYGEDFVLFRSRELVEQGYFGDRGDKAGLLGDYIAIGTDTHRLALLTPDSHRFLGHHTSLTEEMEVPLILLGRKALP